MNMSSCESAVAGEKAIVLLVDRNPADRQFVSSTLHDMPHELVAVASCVSRHCKSWKPQCFARWSGSVDLEMTVDVEGLKICLAMVKRIVARHVPFIFLAAPDRNMLSPPQAFNLGAVDYLTKPVQPEGFRAKVAGLCRLFLEKKHAEQEAAQLRLLIEGTIDYAIFMLDPTGRIVTWNKGAERIKGYRAHEIIGRHFDIFYPKEAIASGWPAHELEVAATIGRFEDKGWRLRQDGSRFWANVVITALRNAEGILVGFSKVTRDLTDQRNAEESLRRAQVDLEERVAQRTAELTRANAALCEADHRKDDFLAMLAHELRNPLSPMRNALEIMKIPGLGLDLVREARDVMERQVEHLVRIVDDLLDVSRIMRGKIDLRKELVDLSSIFTRAVETAQPTIDAQGHQLSISLPEEPLRVAGDLVRLSQVVSNLLVNAAKYTDRAGRIWLTGESEGEHVVVRVQDNGIGIDPDLLPHVFDLFVQADRSLARSQGGLGIGLTQILRLVEMHEGSVTAASPGFGQGAEFIIRLPAARAEGGEVKRPDESLSITHSPRRVLVVDDNVDAAQSATVLLRLMGHQVEVVHNGPAALEAVREFRPEIVLLDIGLPGMSGYDVARALRALPENNGMILAAVTGYGQEEDRRRTREAGFDYHLTKPLPPSTLVAFVSAQGGAPHSIKGD